jgi:digeranylgeranylglycerophospholipid reductase
MGLLRYDIVVVGAGPAGSMAARAAAERGVSVLLLEEHERVGVPVQCAEGLSERGLREAGLKPTDGVVSQKITCARVYAPNRSYIDIHGSNWVGYNLNRDVFDRMLAERAVDAGAQLMTGVRVSTVYREGGAVGGVYASSGERTLKVEARIVIGADGYSSTVRRTAGLGRWYPDAVTCAGYRLGNLNLDEPDVNEIYFGKEVAPGGYAWVFPKSTEVANVGVGVRRIHKAPPIEYLRRFISSDPRFEGAEILMVTGGITPASGILEKIVDDGLMLVGDAAGEIIPCTGAGIHSGMVAGRIAGEVAADAVLEGETGAARLREYRRRFEAEWGKRIRDSRRVVEMLDRFSDEDLNLLAEVLTGEEIVALANGIEVSRVLTRIMRRAPLKVVRLIAAYFRGGLR